VVPEIIEPVQESAAPSEFGDDAQCEWIAANTAEMLTEQVSGSAVVASGRGADHFNVMTLPVHLATPNVARGRFGEGVEIGDGEPEGRIGRDRVTERRYRVGERGGLLRLAIEGCSLGFCCDRPTVVLDGGTGWSRRVTAGVELFWIAMHDYQAGLVV
jgi:hypothetical protein